MTLRHVRKIERVALWLVIVALAALLLVTRSQVGAADGKIHALAMSQARTAAEQTERALAVGVSAQQLAAAIQQSRLNACNDENARHIATVEALEDLIGPALRHARSRAVRLRMRQSLRATLLIIDALAPFHACPQFITASP